MARVCSEGKEKGKNSSKSVYISKEISGKGVKKGKMGKKAVSVRLFG